MSGQPGIERYAVAVRLLGMGWFVAISIAGGVVGGLWLDGRTGLNPAFTLIGLVFGLAVAFYGVFKMAAPLLVSPSGKRKGQG